MYHISKDKRSIQSANFIYHGLLQCLAHKSFDQITITDVQKASGVARTTIYRCFDNLSDILYWRCDLCFREALHSVMPTETPDELNCGGTGADIKAAIPLIYHFVKKKFSF